jgi:glycine cleavage system H lipoate-binding protein
MESPENRHQLDSELPCIWALSGVLSYRLCECNYDCEHCELYRVLSGRVTPSPYTEAAGTGSAVEHSLPCGEETPGLTAHLAHLLTDCRVYLDRAYRPPHFWLRELSGGTGLVEAGLDASLLNILKPIRRVVTTGRGIRLERDQPCGWIARAHMAVTLRMPIAGEVVDTNPLETPGPHARQAAGDGTWLLRIRPSEDLESVPALIRGEETLAWYADRLRVVKEYLRRAASDGDTSLGSLMADGGAPQHCLEDVLGSAAFAELISRIARY